MSLSEEDESESEEEPPFSKKFIRFIWRTNGMIVSMDMGPMSPEKKMSTMV